MTEKIYILEIGELAREKLLKVLSQIQANSEDMIVYNEVKETLRHAEEKKK